MTKPTASISSITFSDGKIIDLEPNEKLMLVGPNNSGKSLTLREMVKSISGQKRDFQRNLVVKDLSLAKSCNSATLRGYLEEVGTFRDQYFQVENWRVHENQIPDWDQPHLLGGLAPGFIKNIAAETRLGITAMQDNISHGDPKLVPQHVLYDDDTLMEGISKLFRQAFGKSIFFNHRGGKSLPIHVGNCPKRNAGEDRVTNSYVEKVRSFPLLHEQGDGVKSYAGILFEAVATERDITLIDEPEAFLHPPQMRRLGETLASEVKGQLVVATHSSDIMRGFLTGTSGSIRIVRMQRKGKVNKVTEASVDAIRTLWEQPDLRYSNALEGIFHEQTIICEGDSDCRLFNSVADHMERDSGKRWRDTAFVPAGGKQNIHKIANVLRQIGVPVTGVYDIDFLSNDGLVRDAVEGFGGDWREVEPLWKRVDAAVTKGVKPPTDDEIRRNIIDLLNKSEGGSIPKSDIRNLLKGGKPWAEVKKFGLGAIPKGQAQTYFATLDAALRALGIVVVPVGEVENYCRDVGLHGPKFVTKLLQGIDLDDDRLADLRGFVKTVHNLRGQR